MSVDVSIIIPTYNRISMLKEALKSVYAQEYSGTYEVIVVDDASHDSTSEIIARDYPDIHLISLQENVGHGSARNHGIKSAKGKYIAFLDSDDLWKPNYLEVQASALANQNRCFAVSGIEVLNLKNNQKYNSRQKPDLVNFLSPLHQLLIYTKTFILSPSSVVIPKYIFDEIGLFEEQYRFGVDSDYYLRCLGEGYEIVFTELVTVTYHCGLDDQLTKSKNLRAREEFVHARINRFYDIYGVRNHDKVPAKEIIEIENYLNFGTQYLLGNQPFNAFRSFCSAALRGAPLRTANHSFFAMKLYLEKVKNYAVKFLDRQYSLKT
ncbi:MAG: glycosyltransferase [Aphanocapsa sp. GSE-SYN-MK-11-07L]|jgi:glycosyltransferase involved in cell wall biosynthesis|nr:glycosyltransferase [Aphanocapsa sp. GSE-SYN-MK-11-07L]